MHSILVCPYGALVPETVDRMCSFSFATSMLFANLGGAVMFVELRMHERQCHRCHHVVHAGCKSHETRIGNAPFLGFRDLRATMQSHHIEYTIYKWSMVDFE